jgi:hypothetical protein
VASQSLLTCLAVVTDSAPSPSATAMLNVCFLPYAASVCIICILATVLYRLCLHPLAKFPGPKLAAATFWYEFYYDVTRRGQYFREIEKMHKRYGMSRTIVMFCYTQERHLNHISIKSVASLALSASDVYFQAQSYGSTPTNCTSMIQTSTQFSIPARCANETSGPGLQGCSATVPQLSPRSHTTIIGCVVHL